jgi:hypothetical protein
MNTISLFGFILTTKSLVLRLLAIPGDGGD